MKISIIGTNGMISEALARSFFSDCCNQVDVYGLESPLNYPFSTFTKLNLLYDNVVNNNILSSDIVIYAAGAGVQAAINTDSSLMYKLNVNVPVEMTLQLKRNNYSGVFISFGSYMEIGANNNVGRVFNENELVYSCLPVTNDYAISKRMFSRYMNDLNANFLSWHFILPNMFSHIDFQPGTRLIPYVLKYLREYRAGKEVEVPSFSAGLQFRQFILLEDVREVIERALSCRIASGVYNIGGGEFMNIRTLIERLFSLYGISCVDTMFGKEVRRDGDIMSLRLDGTKLFEEIQFLPQTKIEDVFSI